MNFKNSLLIGFILVTFTALTQTQAKTIFEGYYLVKLGKEPVGYVVQRYSYDKKDKSFRSIYLIQTNKAGGEIFEAINAKSNSVFEPMSYKYTTKTPVLTKTIDATFSLDKKKRLTMNAVIIANKKKTSVTKTIKKGVFLSSFLSFVMLNHGFKKGKNFIYEAIAEEDAKVAKGTALIVNEISFNNSISAFKIDNTFKGTPFNNIVSLSGEALQTLSPKQNVSVNLVKDKNTALKPFKVKKAAIKYLFGNMPEGKINELHKVVKK